MHHVTSAPAGGASRAHRAADRARLICLYTPGRGERR